jgi:hypothetical protein
LSKNSLNVIPRNIKVFTIMHLILVLIVGCIIGGILIPTIWKNFKTVCTAVSFINNPPSSNDNNIDQLVVRVNDSCLFLQTAVSMFGIIFTILIGAMGYAFWRTNELLKKQLEHYLDPIVDSSINNIRKYSCSILQSIRDASNKINSNNNEIIFNLEKIILEEKGLSEKEVDEKINLRKVELENKRLLMNYLIELFSPDEKIVINAAQQLGESKNFDALEPLSEALDLWGRGSDARLEIQRSMDKIRSLR